MFSQAPGGFLKMRRKSPDTLFLQHGLQDRVVEGVLGLGGGGDLALGLEDLADQRAADIQGGGLLAVLGEDLGELGGCHVVYAGQLLLDLGAGDAERLADDRRGLVWVLLHIVQAVDVALDQRFHDFGLGLDDLFLEHHHVGDQAGRVLRGIDHVEFLSAFQGGDLRHARLVGHADRHRAGGHRRGNRFRRHVDRLDVLLGQLVRLERIGEQEVGRRERIEADFLALEVGDLLDVDAADDRIAAGGVVDRADDALRAAFGDHAYDLVVGQHAAVHRAAFDRGRDQRRIAEHLQRHLEAGLLVKVERIGDVVRAVADPDHRADLYRFNRARHARRGERAGEDGKSGCENAGCAGKGTLHIESPVVEGKAAESGYALPGFYPSVEPRYEAGPLSDQSLLFQEPEP